MSSADRSIPPGQGRVAMAARAGMFAKSEAFSSGLILLVASGTLALFATELQETLSAMQGSALTAAIYSKTAPMELLRSQLYTGRKILGSLFVVVAVAGLAATLIPAWVAKRHRGRTAVPLPPTPRCTVAKAVIRTTASIVFVLLFWQIVRSHLPLVFSFSEGKMGSSEDLIHGLCGIIGAAGAVLVLTGLIEMALERHAYFQSLHLSRLESKREQRAAGGDPGAKSEGRRRQRAATWR